jgi:tetratricopeptide (TPR) repeat protein
LAEQVDILERARSLFRDQEYAEVIQLLTSEAFVGSQLTEVLVMLAASHLSLGKGSEAQPFVEQILRVEPSSARARWLNSRLLAATGSAVAAAMEARAAAEAAPDDPGFREDHFALQMRVSPPQARSIADRLVRDFPDRPESYRCLADLAMYEDRFADAEQAAQRAVELDPASERAYALLGAAQSGQG